MKINGIDVVAGRHGVVAIYADSASVINSSLESNTVWSDPETASSYGIHLANVASSVIDNNSISGFPIGISYFESSDPSSSESKGTYSRMTVSASSRCFFGGKRMGLKNICTIVP